MRCLTNAFAFVLFVGSVPGGKAAVCAELGGSDVTGLRGGAAAVDITPARFPVIVNGYFHQRMAERARDRLMSRALVLDDGAMRLAIVVVDSLMLPRRLLDQAKQSASREADIPIDRMLIAATHTHSAPAAMGCLGSEADSGYQQQLVGGIAHSIARAARDLVPVRVGWTVVSDTAHNHCRRWILRPDRLADDPFGNRSVRANMHPGYRSPNHIGPSGPADTDLTLLGVQTRSGEWLACLANYAMHYYGAPPVSADFCGAFSRQLARRLDRTSGAPRVVAMMSQGTSGDSMWMDYSRPEPRRDLQQYTEAIVRLADEACRRMVYPASASLNMAERKIVLKRRAPDDERLTWARMLLKEKERDPNDRQTLSEIYAREQVYLHETPEVELKLQAIRIGPVGITALPNEVYGLTGLKLKFQSPLATTFNIELANGAEGYIPPPEQHELGGYTTWPARTAGLEVRAEPRIVDVSLELLEEVAGRPRRVPASAPTAYRQAVLASRPRAYWQLDEMGGSRAADAAGTCHGRYDRGVVFYLAGPPLRPAGGPDRDHASRQRPDRPREHVCRAAHFAGGRMSAAVGHLGETYSVEMWLWNGLAHDARPVTGFCFSRGGPSVPPGTGDRLGIGGHRDPAAAGKLIFSSGPAPDQALAGHAVVPMRRWIHVALVREGRGVTVYLHGRPEPELRGQRDAVAPHGPAILFVGGRGDGIAPWEGRIDEVAVFDRALTADEIAAHVRAAGVTVP